MNNYFWFMASLPFLCKKSWLASPMQNPLSESIVVGLGTLQAKED